MKLTVTLDANPTPDDVLKANRAIAFHAGASVMALVAASLQPQAERITTDAPPPPPPPPAINGDAPPPPPPATAAAPATHDASNLDIHGLPWDERIHAGSKTKNKAGDWKARKGLDDATKMAVVAELRQFFPAPNATAVTQAAPPPPPAPATAVMQAAPPPPPAPGGAAMTFVELAQKISPLLTGGKVTQAQVVEACQSVGVPSLPALGQHPDKVPLVNAYIDSLVMMAG